MTARFEVVRTDEGWHARVKGANGEIVMSSEVYTTEETARDAVLLVKRLNRYSRVTMVDKRSAT
jgi:uncharacterized protein YegP (UPF0339 family)